MFFAAAPFHVSEQGFWVPEVQPVKPLTASVLEDNDIMLTKRGFFFDFFPLDIYRPVFGPGYQPELIFSMKEFANNDAVS